ncbi:fimbrial protein [Rosenbergiella sp. S61]|uniref:Fimbrial protein n=1 Tax=Rosenbergiella gaditana TaxID=2726987 RepID=A0ABS5SX70_9GAMM|nr:fimbrial protein [Rosenbergiella gaditana]MBT0724702.1 fimbrial protein [Rosenbergiella gaditana]
MKVIILRILLLVFAFVQINYSAYAKKLQEININLHGTVVAFSCTVDPADLEKTIDLGHWPTRQLNHPGAKSSSIDWSIRLTDCSGNGVKVNFSGKGDKNDASLLALSSDSTATGIAIELLDESHNRLAINTMSKRTAVDKDGNAVFGFSARYITNTGVVTAGTANADSIFTLTYD